MSRDIPKTNFSASPFSTSGNSVQKSIQTSQLSSTTTSTSSNTTSNDQGEIAKSTAEAVQAFSTRLPGTLEQRIIGGNISKPPGSAYRDLNATRNNANDMANWQAMLKGSQETAKALADGLSKAFAGAGAVGQALVAAAKKDGGGSSESSAARQQQQQSAQQPQQLFAQSDAQGQGGGGRAS